MVNLRKIGAIATGALFVGATIGMASAAVSPDFTKNMLAQNGVAQAQLVVGAAAPGKAADEASAKVIQDKVKAKLGLATGGTVSVKYGSNDLDDSGNDAADGWTKAVDGLHYVTDATAQKLQFSNSTGFFNISNRSASYGILIDKDGNGKLNDASDYALYNRMQIVDTRGDARFAYEPIQNPANMSAIDGYQNMLGNTYKIKGGSYAITKVTSDTEIEMGPATTKTIPATTQLTFDIRNSVTLTGTLKAQLVGNGTNHNQSILYLINGDSLDGTVQIGGLSKFNPALGGGTYNIVSGEVGLPASFSGYKMFAKFDNTTAVPQVTLVMADKTQLSNFMNEQTDVMGYSKFFVDLDSTPEGFASPGRAGMFFTAPTISLVRDDVMDLADTYYQLDFNADKQLDVKRKMTISVPSGTKLKSTNAEYTKFLKQTVTVSATGGTPGVGPTLDIKDEAGANKAMNLVLMGGPVANKLTAELATGKKSKVDWLASAGDVEVVKDAFTSGKAAIIVAGKNRDATKKAADDLAAAL